MNEERRHFFGLTTNHADIREHQKMWFDGAYIFYDQPLLGNSKLIRPSKLRLVAIKTFKTMRWFFTLKLSTEIPYKLQMLFDGFCINLVSTLGGSTMG